MKKNYLQTTWRLKKLYGKFYNFQKRLRLLMQTGDYYDFSFEKQNRLIRRLNLLFDRLTRLTDKKRLKWATATVALLVSFSVSAAEFGNPVDISGVKADFLSAPVFADVDDDNSIDLVIGQQSGKLMYFQIEDDAFIERIDSLNPFDSVFNKSAPAFADLDEDGDIDLFVGSEDGTLRYFKNNESVFDEITGAQNPFNGIDVGTNSTPTFADVDDDGDLDLLVGEYWGNVHYFKNELGFVEQTGSDNPFDGLDVGYNSTPTFVDFDKDGDPDLFIGELYGQITYYKNNLGIFTIQAGDNDPFTGFDVGAAPTPAFFDLDGDLDLEFVSGEYYGSLIAYENSSNTFELLEGWDSPFYGIRNSSSNMKPTFADFDNDGDEDLITGENLGLISLFSNIDGQLISKTGIENPFDGFNTSSNSAPTMADVDGDGDLDLVAGNYDGNISYFKNSVGVFTEQTGLDNPFDAITDSTSVTPTFADLDTDGDLDLFVGEKYGTVLYFKNNGGVFTEMTGADNPLDLVDVSSNATPVFYDLDEDGDLDVFVGDKYGTISYFENQEGVFAEITDEGNPLKHISIPFSIDSPFIGIGPTFVDIDEDNDADVFIGHGNGKLYFVANGSSTFFPWKMRVDGTIEDGGTAVNQFQLEGVAINANHNILIIESNDQIIDRVQVYNLSGQLVVEKSIGNSGRNEVSLEKLSTGAYLVRAISGISSTSKKILISK